SGRVTRGPQSCRDRSFQIYPEPARGSLPRDQVPSDRSVGQIEHREEGPLGRAGTRAAVEPLGEIGDGSLDGAVEDGKLLGDRGARSRADQILVAKRDE